MIPAAIAVSNTTLGQYCLSSGLDLKAGTDKNVCLRLPSSKLARLQLLPCELSHFEAIIHDQPRLAALLQVELAEDWLGFAAASEAMQPAYEYLKSHPTALGWWTYLFIHKADRTLIGLGGIKGEVNEAGMVEIGYEIRRRIDGAAWRAKPRWG